MRDSRDGLSLSRESMAQGRPCGLSRQQRLAKPRFRVTYDAGRSSAGRYIVMWLRPTGGPPGQVGFVATKRLFPRAVDRNRARRLLREAYRLSQHHLLPELDMILLARKPILSATRDEVTAGLHRLWRRARIWQEEP